MTTQNLHIAATRYRKMNWVIRTGLIFSAAVLLLGFTSLEAQHYVNISTGLTGAGVPLAIHGYDPVAYFTHGRAVIGRATFTAVHQGAAYRFASQENKKQFENNPERYVPQFGGFCAYGVAVGAKFDGDPTLFRVVNNKLYLNLNPDIQATWEKDIAGNVAKADRNWTEIRDKAPSQLK